MVFGGYQPEAGTVSDTYILDMETWVGMLKSHRSTRSGCTWYVSGGIPSATFQKCLDCLPVVSLNCMPEEDSQSSVEVLQSRAGAKI